MDVGKRRQLDRLHQEHVHQLAVVGQERGAGQVPVGAPLGVVDRQREPRSVAARSDRGRRAPGPVDPAPIGCVDGLPPGPTAAERAAERQRAARHRQPAPPPAPPIRRRAGLEHALAHRRAEDGDGADEEEQAGPGQRKADRPVHLQGPFRHRHHRHEDRAPPFGTGHRHLDAVRAGGHQPQLPAVQVGLAAHRPCGVRRRRACEPHVGAQGAHGDLLDPRSAEDADRGLRQAGNDAGRAHDDPNAVRSGDALEVSVRRADVRGGSRGGGRNHSSRHQRQHRRTWWRCRPTPALGQRATPGIDAHATCAPGPSSCPTTGRRGTTQQRGERPNLRPPRPADGPRIRTGTLPVRSDTPTGRRRRRSCGHAR